MNVNYQKMCKWELEKAVYLQKVAVDLNMDLTGYGDVSVNPSSRYVYLWLEDYPFTLYMPISCELVLDDVWAMWTNPEDGEEIEMSLTNNTRLNDLLKWVKEVEKGVTK